MKRLFLTVALAIVVPASLSAQSADELAVKAANLLADMISFPLHLNNDFGLGGYDRTRSRQDCVLGRSPDQHSGRRLP